jgi:hypothetical protein
MDILRNLFGNLTSGIIRLPVAVNKQVGGSVRPSCGASRLRGF